MLMIGICGASGSGKSTLGHCINGLIPASYSGKSSPPPFVAGFAEVEVELKSGSEEALTAYAAALAAKYGLQIQPKSKFQRAKALVKGERHGF